jgi:hypothetical protein
MMKVLNIDKHNIDLIDMFSLLQQCETDILRDLDMFNLIDSDGANFKKRDTKTVFYFYILKYICEYIINSRSLNKCVFFYNKKCIDQDKLSIFERCDTSKWKFGQFILTFVNKLNNMLPNLFYITDDDICFDQIELNSGECKDMMVSIKSQIMRKNKKIFTFEKSRKFVKEYGLIYLDKHYFDQVKIKSLVYK